MLEISAVRIELPFSDKVSLWGIMFSSKKTLSLYAPIDSVNFLAIFIVT